MKNPSCYACKFRGGIPGDAHSMCHHPLVKQDNNVFSALVAMLSGENVEAQRKLNILADPTGIKRGWFMWPANFDPVWLRNCDGFEAKDPTAASIQDEIERRAMTS